MVIGFLELLLLLALFVGGPIMVIAAWLVLTERLQLGGNFKTCPYCAERIRQEARLCRYCQRDLTGADGTHKPRGLFQ